MLLSLGLPPADIERTCYLIAHHHTYTDIDGIDYQILVEADFLVNIYEDNLPQAQAAIVKERIFKTAAGTRLLHLLFEEKY